MSTKLTLRVPGGFEATSPCRRVGVGGLGGLGADVRVVKRSDDWSDPARRQRGRLIVGACQAGHFISGCEKRFGDGAAGVAGSSGDEKSS